MIVCKWDDTQSRTVVDSIRILSGLVIQHWHYQSFLSNMILVIICLPGDLSIPNCFPIFLSTVGKTKKNHPFGNGSYQLFMVIWGMVYYCFTHIVLNDSAIVLSPSWTGQWFAQAFALGDARQPQAPNRKSKMQL